MRSIPATESMTLPWMTTPRSRTRLTRSLSARRSSSRSKSSSADMARLADEVIWRPGPGELEPESVLLPLPDELRDRALEAFAGIAPDEERRVEHRRARRALDARAPAVPPRQRVAYGLHGGIGKRVVRLGRDPVADALDLLLALRFQFAGEEIPLAWRRRRDVALERRDGLAQLRHRSGEQ